MPRVFIAAVWVLAAGPASPTRAWPLSAGHGRVIGGSNASISDYPYQASLLRSDSHHCGASIISETWTLTAAQCVEFVPASELGIGAGTTTRDSGGTVHTALSVTWHASYLYYTYDCDIAVAFTAGGADSTSRRPQSSGTPPPPDAATNFSSIVPSPGFQGCSASSVHSARRRAAYVISSRRRPPVHGNPY
ncbi:trypsin alpha-like [Schistocerca nitens]|uniref:trypsin alpha-like n=1 Tax=Schistocerca nitens TaxID=7011 RepID=UPI0021186B8B|nr:trypsin alpha-like [Schistocerca nitens]